MFKKLFSILSLSILSLCLVSNKLEKINEVKANETSNESDIISENIDEDTNNSRAISENIIISIDGVGKSINLAKHGFVDYNQIKYDNPIFDPDWEANQIKVKTTYNSSNAYTMHTNSFKNMISELEQHYAINYTNKKGYSLFTAKTSDKFYDTTMDYPNHTYQYYSTYCYYMKNFAYELPDYKTNLSTYQLHLSDEYYDDAESFLNGYIDRTTFFDKYGTHVIAKAVFGGEFEINYSLASSYHDVWGDYYSAISSYLNTSLYSKVSTGDTSNFNVLSNFGFYDELSIERLNFVTRGGSNSIDITHANLQAAFAQWKSTVSASPKIIEATSDGLIPLWDILPIAYDTQTYKDYFIEQYQLYAASCEEEILNNFEPAIFDMECVETGFSLIRTGEIDVTDDGIYEQDYDVIYLDSTFDLKYSFMKANGYTEIDIYLQLEMKEINMGYQIIAFYYSEKESDEYMIHSFEFEYEGTSLGSNYGSTIGFARFHIPIETFINDDPEDCKKVVFRYSARGSGEDTWSNRLVFANVVYFK